VAFTTETSNQNLVVLFDKSQATIVRDESCDLFAVLDKLDTNALADGGVRLFSLNTTKYNNCVTSNPQNIYVESKLTLSQAQFP
jgi:hypothetical protein